MIENHMKLFEVKQDKFEQQFQHFMTDITEMLLTTVCKRINEKPNILLPKVMD